MDAERLQVSSQRWMAAALAAFSHGAESYDFAVHHAGIAAEHLLKAFLTSLHPALVVEGKDFDSLLHTTGQGAHASAPITKIKTIGLVEAHSRTYRILRNKIPISQQDLLPLANARNGVAHSGLHEVTDVRTVFTTCLRLLDPLLVELNISPAAYWGPYQDLHDELIRERIRETSLQLQQKLAQARTTFEHRFGHLGLQERLTVLAAATRRPARASGCVENPCPACHSMAWLRGTTMFNAEKKLARFTPVTFWCLACDLQVQGEELQELGDLGKETTLGKNLRFFLGFEPETQELHEEDWEPDEDFLRGR
ncbi:hypothetical protein [Streptomyces celluloflavus]|uniref:hypothetical protein n=1 Tax=Streptomyces celluloflavus TaxID=58344 RepID=UPI003699F27C